MCVGICVSWIFGSHRISKINSTFVESKFHITLLKPELGFLEECPEQDWW